MAISPVSAVTFGNKHNNVNFEGRKHRNGEEYHSTPIREKLAVPLAATVLAMSPMASSTKTLNDVEFADAHRIEMVNDVASIDEMHDGRVVGSKTFAGVREGSLSYDVKVDLVNTKGGSGYDEIYITHKSPVDTNPLKNKVKGLNKIKLALMSDDGRKGPEFESNAYSYVGSSIPFPLRNDVANYLEDALNSPNYHGEAKVKTISKGLRQTFNSLQNVPNGNKWAQVKQPYDYGKACGSTTITGDRGDKYTVTVYSPDGTDANVNTITLKKVGYPELEILGVVKETAIFEKGLANEKSLVYGDVMLVGQGQSGREYPIILDNKLAASLILILNDAQLERVRKLLSYYTDRTNTYSILESGSVLHYSNDK